MQTSLIIPTLNRAGDLTRCLTSVAQLTQKFDQIIVVEQGDLQTTQRIIGTFSELDIELYFLPVKSLAQARNFGIEKATGDLIFFVDDDTELDQHYARVAHAYFADHPQVMGLTGEDMMRPSPGNMCEYLKALINLILRNKTLNTRVLRSGDALHSLYPYQKPRDIEWLPGFHMAYRKVVFEKFSFNADFIRWSSGEDILLSYQIYKHYGSGSLRYLPAFKIKHHQSEESSLSEDEMIKMQIIYRFIFWQKLVYQRKLINLLCYLYAQLGFIILKLKDASHKYHSCKIIGKTYRFLLKNRRKIATNQIDYNYFILHDT